MREERVAGYHRGVLRQLETLALSRQELLEGAARAMFASLTDDGVFRVA